MMFPKSTVAACLLLASSVSGYSGSFTPGRSSAPSFTVSTYKSVINSNGKRASASNGASSLQMISTGDDRSERRSLDISKTMYTSLIKAPKDAYIAFAEKGASNANMSTPKILHQSIMGGAYVGFGGLLALSVAGNMSGTLFSNPGLVKMTFAALFPVNLLLIVMTGGQLFTGNSGTCTAARYEGMLRTSGLAKNLALSLTGNIIGCFAFGAVAQYVGLLTGGTAALVKSTAVAKCGGAFMPTLVKGILCNWMVSLAVFMAGASNDLVGKLVGCWFPISTFVGIGLEHSIANLFILPAALLLGGTGLTLGDIVFKNLVPVVLGNFIAGALVVAGSYSYQFGAIGKGSREKFRAYLKEREAEKAVQKAVNGAEPSPAASSSTAANGSAEKVLQ